MAKIIALIKSKQAKGPDTIPEKLVKQLEKPLTPNLTQIINQIVSQQRYPAQLIEEKLTAIWKKKWSVHDQGSCRRVAQTSVIGNVVEIAMFRDQTEVEIHQVLPQNIYGYVRGKGTSDAIIDLKERTIQTCENRKVQIVSYDARADFQSVPHQLIDDALELAGADGKTRHIFTSYLRSQAQFMRVGKCNSFMWKVSGRGVFPGVISAGVLFNLSTAGMTERRVIDEVQASHMQMMT